MISLLVAFLRFNIALGVVERLASMRSSRLASILQEDALRCWRFFWGIELSFHVFCSYRQSPYGSDLLRLCDIPCLCAPFLRISELFDYLSLNIKRTSGKFVTTINWLSSGLTMPFTVSNSWRGCRSLKLIRPRLGFSSYLNFSRGCIPSDVLF